MESDTFSLAFARGALAENGFMVLDDSGIGENISEMEQKGFPYFTEYGLDFCKQHILRDHRIRSILESCFERCTLGHWLRYKEYPGHIECFRRGGPKAGFQVLMIHLLPKESRIRYYAGSQRHDLPTQPGKRSLYEISRTALEEKRCEPKEVHLPNGGMAVVDARLGYEITHGYAITFIFATDDVLS